MYKAAHIILSNKNLIKSRIIFYEPFLRGKKDSGNMYPVYRGHGLTGAGCKSDLSTKSSEREFGDD